MSDPEHDPDEDLCARCQHERWLHEGWCLAYEEPIYPGELLPGCRCSEFVEEEEE